MLPPLGAAHLNPKGCVESAVKTNPSVPTGDGGGLLEESGGQAPGAHRAGRSGAHHGRVRQLQRLLAPRLLAPLPRRRRRRLLLAMRGEDEACDSRRGARMSDGTAPLVVLG